jgi:predicted nucleic acid-binding protein
VEPLLVPPTVLAEVSYLLSEWGGPSAEVRFLRSFRPDGLQLAELTTADVARMADLTERYADLRLGGTDASLIALAERLRVRRIATFDRRHFTVVRPAHVEALTLLPENV